MVKPDSPAALETTSRSVKTLSRGLEILTLFSVEAARLSQSEIAARSGLPMPTVHRLVGTLVEHSFLEQVAGGRNLQLGNAIVRLCGDVESRRDPSVVTRQKLHKLSAETGETANLATLVDGWVVYLDGAVGSNILTPNTAIGARLPAHNTALGKSLLALLDDGEVIARLGTGPYEVTTNYTAIDWNDLKGRLDLVREEGVAVSDQEYEVGLTSIAIALPPGPGGSPRAINVSLPTTRATEGFKTQIIARLRLAAAEIGVGG